jgi:hypothetical protein
MDKTATSYHRGPGVSRTRALGTSHEIRRFGSLDDRCWIQATDRLERNGARLVDSVRARVLRFSR